MKVANDANFKKSLYLIQLSKCLLFFEEIITKLLLNIYFISYQIAYQNRANATHYSCVSIADFKIVNAAWRVELFLEKIV